MGARTRRRQTQTEREVQAELRAFAVVVSAMVERLRHLVPVVESLPEYQLVDRASRDGDDSRWSIAWSIAGFLNGREAGDLLKFLMYEAGLTESDVALMEAKARARARRS